LRASYAIVDEHKASRLLSISPDVDFMDTGFFRRDHFPANGGRCFFASSCPATVRSINIVIASDAAGDIKFFFEVAAHPLAEQLLPAIAIFRQSWIGIGFFERSHIRPGLLLCVVDTSRR